MKHSPCKTCKFRTLPKLKPFNYYPGFRGLSEFDGNGSTTYEPEKNYPSPCYDCQKAQDYDDFMRELLDSPPLTKTPWGEDSEPEFDSFEDKRKVKQESSRTYHRGGKIKHKKVM